MLKHISNTLTLSDWSSTISFYPLTHYETFQKMTYNAEIYPHLQIMVKMTEYSEIYPVHQQIIVRFQQDLTKNLMRPHLKCVLSEVDQRCQGATPFKVAQQKQHSNQNGPIHTETFLSTLLPVLLTIFTHNSKFIQHLFWHNSIPDKQIATNVCTCHDSTSLMACANFCNNHLIGISIRENWYFHGIWTMTEKC